MAHLITGLFIDRKEAREAIEILQNSGDTKDISLVAKDADSGETTTHTVKQDGEEGAVTGATTGAIVGAAATVIAGITAIAIPGIGLVTGAMATALAAATGGAVAGGIVGYLVDKGIPDDVAKEYEEKLHLGEIVVAVEIDPEKEQEVVDILQQHGALSIHHI